MRKLNAYIFLIRSWYYLRQGYNYLSVPRSIIISLVAYYVVLVQFFPSLRDDSGLFISVGVIFLIVLSVGCTGIGYAYLKRSQIWKTEADVGVEANPYNFKLAPGYMRDVWAPALLILLDGKRGRKTQALRRKLRKLTNGDSLLDGELITKF